MKVKINNTKKDVQAQTLAALAEEMALPGKGVAVAVNNRMVPRTNWTSAAIKEGDNIVIIKAVCGG